ncbi:hypothetical protein [Salipiger abyssi]|uniref:Uncharacterized protein n=1 Tax=Salipiger abyssi TaxID=1250539 RepID=A0A1P8UWG2_9RHOB|nr:hypothetical protein [Salipiger abyssi]APZ53732.1 hypothetical protein Ga0080574_TMP3398 [Salipiger abyssi]
MSVFYVTAFGTVHTALTADMRFAAEAARIADVKARGAVPQACGPAIPEAPARGCFRVVETFGLYPKGADDWERKPAGHDGRKTMELQDNFGEMLAHAARRRAPAPLSSGQIAMGRFYRDLHERHRSAGLRCSSVETMSGGSSGTAASFMDAVLADRERLDVLRRRIGDGASRHLRVIRPSKRGSRTTISDRALVDMVCLDGLHLDAVLRRHGWSVKGETRKAARMALAEALDRMMGPMRRRSVTAASFGEGPASIWDQVA